MYTQMTGTLPVSSRWLMTGAVATTLLAAPAVAQVDKEVEIAHIVVVKDGPGVQSKSIEVRVENGEISVKVDGEEVPVDRLGDVLESFGVVLDPDDFDFDFGFDLGFRPDDMRFGFPPDFEPKVILGIQMAPPGAALERHLRLEPGTTTMISGLYEGLPAQVAGLEEFDIIVAVDGRKPAGAADIRKALADRESGDIVELTVIHEGRTKSIDVTLKAFDRTEMESARLLGKRAGPEGWLRSLRAIPGPDIDLRRLLVDPEDRRIFRLPQGRAWERLEKSLGERMPADWDERLNHLHDRLAELQEMLDRLLQEED